jgi:membrane protease YdiL (CAAX protease family)
MMRRRWGFFLAGLLVSLLIAGVASFYASSAPDGLEKVAADRGFEDTAKDRAMADGPLADYGTRGVSNARLSGGLAGVAGVTITLIAAGGLFWLLAYRRRPAVGESPAAAPTPDSGT